MIFNMTGGSCTGAQTKPVIDVTYPQGSDCWVVGAIEDTVSGAIATFESPASLPVKSLTVDIEPVQSGSGDPSPDNVRPISGWTGVNVTRAGKNLFDIDNHPFLSAYFVKGIITQSDYHSMTYIPCNPNTTYTVSKFRLSANDRLAVAFANELPTYGTAVSGEKAYAEMGTIGELMSLTITTDESAKYLVVHVGWADLQWSEIKPQIEVGNTATAYEPYQGESYAITFPTEAGTVYGGTLDVTTGLLTVDRMYSQPQLSEINTPSSAPNWRSAFTTPGKIGGRIDVDKMCNALPVVSFDAIAGMVDIAPTAWYWLQSSLGIALPVSIIGDDPTIQDFQGWVSDNDVKFIVRLGTPVTYQLTPTEVTTLLGANNIYADTGDSTVTYLKGSLKYKAKDDSGHAIFVVPNAGEWVVVATDGDNENNKIVDVEESKITYVTLSYFKATINVTYPQGSVCTATDGVSNFRAPDTSGSWSLIVPNVGTWTISCTDGDNSNSETVEITTENQTENIELVYILYLFKEGDTCEDVTGGWNTYGDGVYSSASIGETISIDAQKYNASAYVWTVNNVDMSKYSTLHVHIVSSLVGTGEASFVLTGGSASASFSNFSGEVIKTLDVSAVTSGEVRLYVRGDWEDAQGYGRISADRVWLSP